MNTSEYMSAFLEELDEQLVQMEQKILQLEEHADDSTVQDLFRVAHTLKGSCAAMGFEEMKNLTHAMEQVLDEVRNHRLNVSEPMIQLLFQCFDGLMNFKEYVSSDTDAASSEQVAEQTDGLLKSLREFLQAPTADPTDSSMSKRATSLVLAAEAKLKAAEDTEQGLNVYDVLFQFSSDSVMRGVRAYIAVGSLKEIGDVIQVSPALETMDTMEDETLNQFHVAFATKLETEQVKSAVASSEYAEVNVSPLELQPSETSPTPPVAEKRDGQAAPTPVRKSKSIRVDVQQLETLMNLVGELVIDQTRIDLVNRNLGKRYEADSDVATLGDISAHVSRIVSELQENIMMARMLPVESLFDRFPRIVRDLAHTLGKDVHFSVEGKETRLDRTVIEEIADPLIHLIRNAVDHGIESKEKRVQAGKSTEGQLRLTAKHEDNKAVITLEDDGAGMNPERLRQAAIEKGVITPEQAQKLTENECLYLIFRPGFSTAEKLSDVSGRGVGMDIVRNNIERLNGTIEIQTRVGQGTAFVIKLPLTLTIIPGLLVGTAERTFVIPVNNVQEIVEVQSSSIQSVHGQPMILSRGYLTPIVHLGHFLGFNDHPSFGESFSVVVIRVAEKRVALVVDAFYGNQDIVKKALPNSVGTPKGISGATILGDGDVALILDVAQIA